MTLTDMIYEYAWNKEAQFTIKDYDHTVDGRIYLSLRKLYLAFSDPLEHRFASTVLGDYESWLTLCECNKFKDRIEGWRKELTVKIRSEALLRIIEESRADTKNTYAANKFLVEAGWTDKDSPVRGRPLKVVEEDDPITHEKKAKDDFARLFKIKAGDVKDTGTESVN